jgi:class 3 adenylate cyclase
MSVIRRLAAILAADVVGFSRLMEADEAGTLAVLKARRKEVLEPLVAKHKGRVFKVAGDGVLVEFASAVNAVQCAVDLQQAMVAANGGQPEERHIILRIGVNLGDVIVESGDLYDDDVNFTARLEGIAEPGGILVSGTAYDHIKSKFKVGFDDLGPQTLKNIAELVRAYCMSLSMIRPTRQNTSRLSSSVVLGPTYSDPASNYAQEDSHRFPHLNHPIFVLSQNGTVFQRDRGENTPLGAAAIQVYDPEVSWSVAGE